ncbi:PREDICTED: S-antigen protein-like [Charadrius vociferus]|uniref:S-antigen protein-like n=1 Tax=Charadrius vociferus TaxID=50402 RepID=UPI000521236A|nr:PREDICTED: S-antigen protein-like [Charadrius vociferus]
MNYQKYVLAGSPGFVRRREASLTHWLKRFFLNEKDSENKFKQKKKKKKKEERSRERVARGTFAPRLEPGGVKQSRSVIGEERGEAGARGSAGEGSTSPPVCTDMPGGTGTAFPLENRDGDRDENRDGDENKNRDGDAHRDGDGDDNRVGDRDGEEERDGERGEEHPPGHDASLSPEQDSPGSQQR